MLPVGVWSSACTQGCLCVHYHYVCECLCALKSKERREGRREGAMGEGGVSKLLYLVSHLLWCTAQASLPGG